MLIITFDFDKGNNSIELLYLMFSQSLIHLDIFYQNYSFRKLRCKTEIHSLIILLNIELSEIKLSDLISTIHGIIIIQKF